MIIDILFPRFCLGCGREGSYICDKCKLFVSEAIPVCPVCGYPSEKGETHKKCLNRTLDGLTCLYDYEGLIKQLIKMMKYNDLLDAVKELINNVRISYTYIGSVPNNELAKFIAEQLAKNNNCLLFKNQKVKNLILVDDLFEDSMKQYARTLKQKGAENIWGFVLAKNC